MMGRYVTAGQVFREVNEDVLFYENSGGGVTLSGGEPLVQPDFSIGILKLCKEAGIHTAIDTCGFAAWDTLKTVLEFVDLALFDFKHMDRDQHKKYTGVSNELILENAKRIHHELALPMLARVPLLPGYNDSEEDLKHIAAFIAGSLGDGMTVHLLPYHRLGVTKYERMGEPDKVIPIQPPGDEHMEKVKTIFDSFDLTVKIGG